MGLDQYLCVVTKEELQQRIERENMPEDTVEQRDLKWDMLHSWEEGRLDRLTSRYWRKQSGTHSVILAISDLCQVSSSMWYFQSSFGTNTGWQDEDFPSLIGTDTYYLYTISY
jgi:hypothetical protein